MSAQLLLDIVVEAWTQALLRREAGGDSLGLMRLLLALEKSLGRKLTFDQLDPDMTATQLARILVQQTIAVPESNTARVHLIPGILGDDPTFGDFRRSLVGVRTALVELPDLSCPSRVLRDIGETDTEAAIVSVVAALAEWSRTRSRNASPPAVAKSLSWRCSTPMSSIKPNHATLSHAVSSGRNRSWRLP